MCFIDSVQKNVKKSIGFIDRATEIVEKPVVLQAKRPKKLKNQWFYYKTSSGQPPGNRATDPGVVLHLLGWMSYEEPLQTSC